MVIQQQHQHLSVVVHHCVIGVDQLHLRPKTGKARQSGVLQFCLGHIRRTLLLHSNEAVQRRIANQKPGELFTRHVLPMSKTSPHHYSNNTMSILGSAEMPSVMNWSLSIRCLWIAVPNFTSFPVCLIANFGH